MNDRKKHLSSQKNEYQVSSSLFGKIRQRLLGKRKVYDIGIAMSGGGVRGTIHIGVLKAFEEAGIYPEIVSGTSFGAIVASLYAAGYSADDMLETLSRQNITNMFRIELRKGGLLRMQYLEQVLKEKIPENRFSSLKRKLYICATNLNKGQYEFFDQGELHNKIIASSSIPGLFRPVWMGNNQYVDGGLLNNLPIQPLSKTCKIVIGIHVNKYKTEEHFLSINSVLSRTFTLAVEQNVVENLAMCDYIIEPFLEEEFNVMDFSRVEELFQIGYKEGQVFLKRNRKQLLR